LPITAPGVEVLVAGGRVDAGADGLGVVVEGTGGKVTLEDGVGAIVVAVLVDVKKIATGSVCFGVEPGPKKKYSPASALRLQIPNAVTTTVATGMSHDLGFVPFAIAIRL
jgi:hypothetical protein